MRKLILLLLLLSPFLSFSQVYENNDSYEELFTVFYNLENLFDTIDSPQSNDSEFLPNSKKQWNSYRYNHKLRQLGKVFSNLAHYKNNNNMPDIIGLCEVENRLVIEDLLKTPAFSNQDYTIVHQDGPDSRGIDCALLFSNKFKLLKYDFISIKNSNEKRPTRDIVYVKLAFKDEIINVFVNHWPSRWGGQAETNHKRLFAAKVLKDYLQSNISNAEYTLIMGDFNDYPFNESIAKVLVSNDFINLMATDLVSGKGSYNFRGNWNWLDQIIISKNFKNSDIQLLSYGSFQRDFMLYENSKGEVYPSRSFGGDTWYGGFSDHLPIYFKSAFIF
ncbi:MAG: endonuclease [Flavobacteriales bacterium]|nr:endonuclease [Flavobacteriales bacterium]|tara:strand:- start:496 stop:1491 length:996 start_codon:yes stop_codon:yes gene_type:complete